MFFKKRPSTVCPKCGKAEGWHAVTEDAPQVYASQASAVNAFSPALIRTTFGQTLSGAMGKKSGKLRFRCDSCGCEKTY